MILTYSDLRCLPTFRERFDYLEIGGLVGESTFGFDRWINQQFYQSREWKLSRNHVLVRDRGFDLGANDAPIFGAHLIHHMNPLTVEDIEAGADHILDPEYLITTSLATHNAIHYGGADRLPQPYIERSPGDTKLW
jgi:hypothetical protein